MGSKELNTLRFAVGSPDNVQSSIWRLWVDRKNDVYLGARALLEMIKISLHQSGIWRIAFVKKLESADEKSDRVILKWQRPSANAQGWTPSIGIYISPILANQPFRAIKKIDGPIHWISPAKSGNKLLFKVYYLKPGISENELSLAFRNQVVGKLTKKDGETVWLMKMEGKTEPAEMAYIKDAMGKVKINLKAGASGSSIAEARVQSICSVDVPTASTQPIVYDISLGEENLAR